MKGLFTKLWAEPQEAQWAEEFPGERKRKGVKPLGARRDARQLLLEILAELNHKPQERHLRGSAPLRQREAEESKDGVWCMHNIRLAQQERYFAKT